MKKISCVYTAGGLQLPLTIEEKFAAEMGELEFNHISDSGIMRDIIRAGGVTKKTERRLLDLFAAAVDSEPDMVLCTCSSIGEVAEKAQALHSGVKILRIDEAMAMYAAENYERVAVLAAVETTIGPSSRLVERIAANMEKPVTVTSLAASEAFPFLVTGETEKAFAHIKAAAVELCAQADVLLLAQASMCSFTQALERVSGKPVICSPELCAKQVKEMFWQNRKIRRRQR